MDITRHRARTAIALSAAGAAVVVGLLLTPRSGPERCTTTSDIVKARLTSTRVLPGDQDIAVTIRMPQEHAQTRPPLSVAIVIDRSGSMLGTPLANAKSAAAELVDQLDDRDAFAIVTYSTEVETVAAMKHATASNKAAATAAIDAMWSEGSTCISCGLQQGARELAATPVRSGVRRMVLISDGQANAGVSNRADLAELATQTAARGMSISTVGVGLDFDEVTMTRLADVGHGHYYFVEDTAKLGAMFHEELGHLSDTVAADVRLVVTAATHVSIEEAYGYPTMRQGNAVTIPIADLRAGETRKVVLHASIATNELGTAPVAHVTLHWRTPSDGSFARADAELATTIVDDPAAAAATTDRETTSIVQEARTAHVLEQAATTYEQQGAEAAQQMIEHHLRNVREDTHIDAPAMEAIETASEQAIRSFATAPAAKAMKATRADAHKLAR